MHPFTSSPNTAPHNFGSYKIDQIRKYDYNFSSQIQKKIDFTYFNNHSCNRLVLERVTETGRSGISLPPYIFEYNSTSLPAPYDSGRDFWGYANGNCCGYIHAHCDIPSSGDANRLSNFSSAKAGTLEKITYPTGGYTRYIYEPHKVAPFTISYACEETYSQVGGLRIQKIEHYNKDHSKVSVREYKYLKQNGIESSGISLNDIEFMTPSGFEHAPICGGTVSCQLVEYSCTQFQLNPHAIVTSNYFQKGSVGYSRVEEVMISTSGNDNSGKIVFEFYNVNYGATNYQRNGELLNRFVFNSADNLIQQDIYTYYLDDNPSNDYNTYKKVIAEPELQGLNEILLCYDGVGYFWRLPYNCPSDVGGGGFTCMESYIFETRFKRRTRSFRTLYNYQTSHERIDYVYDGGTQNAISTLTNYEYNYQYAMTPTRISITNSDGVTLNEIRFNYPSSTEQPDLFNKRMRNKPILVERYVGGARVYGYKTIYAYFGASLKPSVIQEAFDNGTYNNVEEISAYDNAGKILESKRTHGQENAYLWSEDQMHMAAYVQNAKQSEILYASFEKPVTNEGGWVTASNYIKYNAKKGASGNGYYQGATLLGYWFLLGHGSG